MGDLEVIHRQVILFWYLERSWTCQSTSTIQKPRRDPIDYKIGDIVAAKYLGRPYRAVIIRIADTKEDLLEEKVFFDSLLNNEQLKNEDILAEMNIHGVELVDNSSDRTENVEAESTGEASAPKKVDVKKKSQNGKTAKANKKAAVTSTTATSTTATSTSVEAVNKPKKRKKTNEIQGSDTCAEELKAEKKQKQKASIEAGKLMAAEMIKNINAKSTVNKSGCDDSPLKSSAEVNITQSLNLNTNNNHPQNEKQMPASGVNIVNYPQDINRPMPSTDVCAINSPPGKGQTVVPFADVNNQCFPKHHDYAMNNHHDKRLVFGVESNCNNSSINNDDSEFFQYSYPHMDSQNWADTSASEFFANNLTREQVYTPYQMDTPPSTFNTSVNTSNNFLCQLPPLHQDISHQTSETCSSSAGDQDLKSQISDLKRRLENLEVTVQKALASRTVMPETSEKPQHDYGQNFQLNDVENVDRSKIREANGKPSRPQDVEVELVPGYGVKISVAQLDLAIRKAKRSGTALARLLCVVFFDESTLANSCARGSAGLRPALDSKVIDAVIKFVSDKCGTNDRDIIQAINSKCTEMRNQAKTKPTAKKW